MDLSFLRQLTLAMDEETAGTVYEILQDAGMEVYGQEEFHLITSRSDARTAGCLYLAAADRKEAVRILTEKGFASVISEEIKPVTEESELERAERLYYKKRRNTMISWLIVIVLALIYCLLKAYVI